MEDEREEELTTLESIYPEIVRDDSKPFTFTLVLPITPEKSIRLSVDDGPELTNMHPVDEVQHLPPLIVTMSLPSDYPAEAPPAVSLSAEHEWVPQYKLEELQTQLSDLWQEYGGMQVLFSYIDHLQQAAELNFNLGEQVSVSHQLRCTMLGFDRSRRKQIFEQQSYPCGVCLDRKSGSLCHRMSSCGHIFCRSCLLDFYNSAIAEGDVGSIKCLEPGCGKKAGDAKGHKPRAIHPRELMEIGIPEPTARRFVEIRQKKKVEADKSTIYCPRTWCQAVARNDRYKPIPTNLLDYVDIDDTPYPSGPAPPVYTKDTPENRLPPLADRVTICSKCTFAFCRVCYAGWHGEYARCWPRNPADLTAEDKASYEFIKENTTPCPTCGSPTQKTMGCNHMKCFQCNTHFCYLCSAWLAPDNPYQHYNKKGTGCYSRLWEGLGDENELNAAIEMEERPRGEDAVHRENALQGGAVP